MDNEKLIGKELGQVGGGKGNGVSDGNNEVIKYCKYCKKETPQIFKGSGYGYDKYGLGCMCNLWECTVCKQTNYWRLAHGREKELI